MTIQAKRHAGIEVSDMDRSLNELVQILG